MLVLFVTNVAYPLLLVLASSVQFVMTMICAKLARQKLLSNLIPLLRSTTHLRCLLGSWFWSKKAAALATAVYLVVAIAIPEFPDPRHATAVLFATFATSAIFMVRASSALLARTMICVNHARRMIVMNM
jgi:hypothetical protein